MALYLCTHDLFIMDGMYAFPREMEGRDTYFVTTFRYSKWFDLECLKRRYRYKGCMLPGGATRKIVDHLRNGDSVYIFYTFDGIRSGFLHALKQVPTVSVYSVRIRPPGSFGRFLKSGTNLFHFVAAGRILLCLLSSSPSISIARLDNEDLLAKGVPYLREVLYGDAKTDDVLYIPAQTRKTHYALVLLVYAMVLFKSR